MKVIYSITIFAIFLNITVANLRKFTMAYQKLNLKQDIRTIKSPSTTKSTKMTRNYRMNSRKSKLQKKSQS